MVNLQGECLLRFGCGLDAELAGTLRLTNAIKWMDELIGNSNQRKLSAEELAAECASVSDKLNNVLTGIQIKAGLLLEQAQTEREREGLQVILETSKEAAMCSERLRQLSGV